MPSPPRLPDPDTARRPAGPSDRSAPVARALLAMLVALLLGALMNADSLADTAERQPFGWQRTAAVAAVRPLEVVADATRLGGLNAWLTDSVGGWFRQAPGRVTTAGSLDNAGRPAPADAPDEPEQNAQPSHDRDPGIEHPAADGTPRDGHPAADGRQRDEPHAADRTPRDEHPPADGTPRDEHPTADRAPGTDGGRPDLSEHGQPGLHPGLAGWRARRTPTSEEPLEVWLTGDSLVEAIGSPLDTELNEAVPAEVRTDPNYATGLARPDYFDWHAYAEESLADSDPDVVVLMMGGNDDQDIRDADGQVLRHDADEWQAEYERRAVALLDRLVTEERDVFWVGMPMMQDPQLDDRMRRIDRIYQRATEAHPRAHHVPTRDLFAVEGDYASYMEVDGGGVERVRRDDGLHLTFAGGRVLVDRRLAAVITERWAP